MKIKPTSVFVNDQKKALDFHTRTPGFVKKTEITAAEEARMVAIAKKQ